MSASKIDNPNLFDPSRGPVFDADHTLHLSPENTLIRQNGIEFRSETEINQWTEMTVALHDPEDGREITATGIVVACKGDRHQGYRVSMLMMNLSAANRARLELLAYSNLA